jgi:hypothetical protein
MQRFDARAQKAAGGLFIRLGIRRLCDAAGGSNAGISYQKTVFSGLFAGQKP